MKNITLFFRFTFILIFPGIPNILFAQNMGIGTSNPSRAKLEISGATGPTTAIFGGETTGISFQYNWPGIGFNHYHEFGDRYISNGYAAKQYLDPNLGYMFLDMYGNGIANTNTNAGIRALSISNAGNIGIKTNPANASLYIIKAGNPDGAVVFGGTSYNCHFKYGTQEHTYIRGGRYGSRIYLNDIATNSVVFGSGNSMLGINTGNPTYTLEIVQNNNRGSALKLIDPDFDFHNWKWNVTYSYLNNGHSNLEIHYSGGANGFFTYDGQYASNSSDRRIKTNIQPLADILAKVNLLQPSVYEMKDHNDGNEKTFGFIAQDVKPLFPGLVSVHSLKEDSINQIPDLHGLNYTGFSVIAIKALQEQYEQIQDLQKEQEILMQRLKALNKKIDEGVPGNN